MKQYDVIVIGGGLTGVAAAISASKGGCRTLLVEKGGCFGGAAVNCLVNPFMCYWRGVEKDGKIERETVNAGVFKIILERLDEMGGLDSGGMTFNEEYLKLILDRLCYENNVDVLFHSVLAETTKEKDNITHVTLDTIAGKLTLGADYFIDCTGDAQLAFLAGCSYHIGREGDNLCQPMSTCFRIGNVDMERYCANAAKIDPLYRQFQKEGKIKNPRENVLKFKHMTDGVIHINATRVIRRNPTDPFDLSLAEREAREQVYELFAFLKENCEGFEQATLLMTAPQIGVRESRMIDGDYNVTAEELLNCIKYEDSIARGCYDIDIHNPDGSGTTIKSIPGNEYYTIPYRALIPKGVNNLLVAGRCISSTHEAQSAYRIMPIVCCIGEGAGYAAAIAKKHSTDIRNVDINEIHQLLDKAGALY